MKNDAGLEAKAETARRRKPAAEAATLLEVRVGGGDGGVCAEGEVAAARVWVVRGCVRAVDRKSTRLNSSHAQ